MVIVTAPVAATLADRPVLVVIEVTPALVSVTVPPRATAPPPERPVPAVTVIEELFSALFGMLVSEAPEPEKVPACIVPAMVTEEGSDRVTPPVEADAVIWLAVPEIEVTPVLAIVMEPVEADTEIPVPAVAAVTPVLLIAFPEIEIAVPAV